MSDKKAADRGVVDSIAALRQQRYMTRGPGQFERKQRKASPAPTVDQLRSKVATVAKKATKKKPRKREARR